jgi:hypothetical protein
MVAVIMVPMIRHLYTAAGKTAKLVTIVNVVYLALLAIILVCWQGIYTFIRHSEYADNYGYFYLDQHSSRLAVAYPAMTAFAILMAGAIMLFLLARNSSLGRWVSSPSKVSPLSSSTKYLFSNTDREGSSSIPDCGCSRHDPYAYGFQRGRHFWISRFQLLGQIG